MRSRPMSLFASALFLVLAPGTIAVVVPWWLTGWRSGPLRPGLDGVRLAGLVFAVAAFGVLLDAFCRFAWVGRGTPAPILPPETLVISGLYRHVRNPMYLAVLCMLLGQAVWLWRWELVAYAGAVACAFDLFVRFYEEPKLRAEFGQSYSSYCRHVRRWIPSLKPWVPRVGS